MNTTHVENLSATKPIRICHFCKNGRGHKKLRYVYGDHQVIWCCSECQRRLKGRKEVELILSRVYISREQTLYKRADIEISEAVK